MRYSLIVAISVGAFFGATIGAMYDDVLEPGRITLIGAGIGTAWGQNALQAGQSPFVGGVSIDSKSGARLPL